MGLSVDCEKCLSDDLLPKLAILNDVLDQLGKIAGVVHKVAHVADWIQGSLSLYDRLGVTCKVSLDGIDVATSHCNLHFTILLAR